MFSLPPDELKKRRARCRESAAAVGSERRELRNACNICGHAAATILATRDRHQIECRTAMCSNCGLVYLVDPLSWPAYADFYASGTHRRLSSAFDGRAPRLDEIYHDQKEYAHEPGRVLKAITHARGFDNVLDIGGGTGGAGGSFAKRFGCRVTVLDPSPEEIAVANGAGLEGVVGTLDTFKTRERFDLILLCRTIEHLPDLRASLEKIRGLLKPDGILYADIADLVESCRRTGTVEAVTRIDHCYRLCQETAPGIFRAAGFEIAVTDVSSSPETVKYLLRPCEPAPAPSLDSAVLHGIVRQLRQIDGDWRDKGRTGKASPGWLKRLLSKARRSIRRRVTGMDRFLPGWSVAPQSKLTNR